MLRKTHAGEWPCRAARGFHPGQRRHTSGGPDVLNQVSNMLPAGWRSSLLALDGAMMGDLSDQLFRLPANATHAVVSIGGNDVLQSLDVLRLCVGCVAGDDVHNRQRQSQRTERLSGSGRPDGVQRWHSACGIRVTASGDRSPARLHRARRLREPDRAAIRGGEKIARAILRSLGRAPASGDSCRVYFRS